MTDTDAYIKPISNVDVKTVFGINTNFEVTPYLGDAPDEYVPKIDEHYQFEDATTQALLAGFALDRRVLVHGLHGTGKSSHVEQIAARLNWPLLRINLDGHLTRMDLVGRDAIELKDGKQITVFKDGLIPWAMQRGVALLFDEYDAARPEVLFVLQRLLETDGNLTLPEQNRVISPREGFRLFATANTVGLGDVTGMYHGTHPINQGQMDRWNVAVKLDYPEVETEIGIVHAKVPQVQRREIAAMVAMANLVREGFRQGDISTTMSPRTVLSWAQNRETFGQVSTAFKYSFLNKCDDSEHGTMIEYYQRCFGNDSEAAA